MANPKKTNPVTFGHYCVALIDILGQQQMLQKLKELPSTEDERKEFIQLAYFIFSAREGAILYSISTKTTEYPVAMRPSSRGVARIDIQIDRCRIYKRPSVDLN